MATFSCPSCARPLEAESTYRDWTVRCPHCAAEFVPEEVARAAFDTPPPSDPGAEERERMEIRARVFGPGVCLELCGWLGGFLVELSAFAHVIVALAQLNNPNGRNPNNPPELMLVLGLLSGLLGVPFALVLIVGGRKMRELSSLPWALSASVAALGSFVFLYVVCVCALIPPALGLWSLLALSNPTVRRAFEENRARQGQWEG
jgi:hypothetical protein